MNLNKKAYNVGQVSNSLISSTSDKTNIQSPNNIKFDHVKHCFFYFALISVQIYTKTAPLVDDLFLFCYERDFMLSLSDDNQSEVIEAFNSTSRYLDELLNIDNTFDSMVDHIYPAELQSNKANVSDTEASFFYSHLSRSDGFVKTKFFVNGITLILIL